MTPRLLLLSLALPLFAVGQDTSLHDFLIEGEQWKEAASGYVFTDGLCTDAAGNLFFTDVKAGKGIYKLDVATGKSDLFLDNLPGISGLQIGPDGRFYACHNKDQRIIAISMKGEVEVLLTNVKCNDLGATTESKGRYFVTTELGVQIFDPMGRLSGIIAKPDPMGKVVGCEFAGKDHDLLFVAAGDKIFSRKLKVTGYFR
jgi:sugar lactone lactonase YvrE